MLDAAHELRNLFTVIHGYSTMCEVGKRPPSYCFAKITDAVERCNDVVNEMLERAGLSPCRPDENELDLNSVAREVSSAFIALSGPRPIRFGVNLEEDLPTLPGPDARRIYRAVLNLCLNCEEAGAKFIVLTTAKDGHHGGIWLSVSDDGCGMSAEKLANIMNGGTELTQERGRGLSIVRSTLRNAGGELLCESEEGIGTTFTILFKRPTLPAVATCEQAAAVPAAG